MSLCRPVLYHQIPKLPPSRLPHTQVLVSSQGGFPAWIRVSTLSQSHQHLPKVKLKIFCHLPGHQRESRSQRCLGGPPCTPVPAPSSPSCPSQVRVAPAGDPAPAAPALARAARLQGCRPRPPTSCPLPHRISCSWVRPPWLRMAGWPSNARSLASLLPLWFDFASLLLGAVEDLSSHGNQVWAASNTRLHSLVN